MYNYVTKAIAFVFCLVFNRKQITISTNCLGKIQEFIL
ncbi:hypothetical protein TSAR_005114 [Trichomalopsis sarcophagae]|uniref:Uncharacterized protein n=1 Tax=Trichomalopsis sarcophagae TaxID=543379 RepID=A0A232EDU5_9HYME|nr:hypothetical protein TSAR_005114 [Trichomalopsis sarcophagae]